MAAMEKGCNMSINDIVNRNKNRTVKTRKSRRVAKKVRKGNAVTPAKVAESSKTGLPESWKNAEKDDRAAKMMKSE